MLKNFRLTVSDVSRQGGQINVQCSECGRERLMDPGDIRVPRSLPVSAIGKNMLCSNCGSKKILARQISAKSEVITPKILAIASNFKIRR